VKHCAIWITLLFWSVWNFLSRLFRLRLSQNPKPDQEKMGVALGKLAQEDPSFRVRTDEETGQTIISGMGELHLDIMVDRMRVSLVSKPISASLRLPIVNAFATNAKSKVNLCVSPVVVVSTGIAGYVLSQLKIRTAQELEFVNEVVGGTVPKEYIPAIQKGIAEQMKNGILAGYPLLGLKATVFDGSYHDVDSNEMAFKVAASMATKELSFWAVLYCLNPL
jgi:elongation factor G